MAAGVALFAVADTINSSGFLSHYHRRFIRVWRLLMLTGDNMPATAPSRHKPALKLTRRPSNTIQTYKAADPTGMTGDVNGAGSS
jgi:hypothetical protein